MKLRCLFVFDKKARRKIQDDYKAARNLERLNAQKWGVAYSVYDGEELLEASIRAIRPEVDYVCVVWQRVSWYGVPADAGLLPLLEQLKEQNLIDEIVEYEVNLKWRPGKNETRKRNLGLKAARKAGCTYFMSMDTDEFYRQEELIKAKKFITERNITHSYCAVNAYGIKPTELLNESGCCIQFFSRLTPFSKHCNEHRATALVDPTRKFSHTPWWLGGSRHYFVNVCRMHHYTYIRKNLARKLQNSSCEDVRLQGNSLDTCLQEKEILICPDWFRLGEIMEKF